MVISGLVAWLLATTDATKLPFLIRCHKVSPAKWLMKASKPFFNQSTKPAGVHPSIHQSPPVVAVTD